MALNGLPAQATDGQYAVIGGVAVGIRGVPRTTSDLDVLLIGDTVDEARLAGLAADAGLAFRPGFSVEFAKKYNVFGFVHVASETPIDLSFGFLPFENETVRRATVEFVLGLELPVSTLEDLVIQKFVAGRNIDFSDIENLFIHAQTRPDLQRIRHWCQEFAEILEQPDRLERLERLIAEAETS
jgi:hypothetical protein